MNIFDIIIYVLLIISAILFVYVTYLICNEVYEERKMEKAIDNFFHVVKKQTKGV